MRILTFRSTYDNFELTLAIGPKDKVEKRFGFEIPEGAAGAALFPED